jgi:hypothetical protein
MTFVMYPSPTEFIPGQMIVIFIILERVLLPTLLNWCALRERQYLSPHQAAHDALPTRTNHAGFPPSDQTSNHLTHHDKNID